MIWRMKGVSSRVCWWSLWGLGTNRWWHCRSQTGSAAPSLDESSAEGGEKKSTLLFYQNHPIKTALQWNMTAGPPCPVPRWRASCSTCPSRPTPPTPLADQQWTRASTGCCRTSGIKETVWGSMFYTCNSGMLFRAATNDNFIID